ESSPPLRVPADCEPTPALHRLAYPSGRLDDVRESPTLACMDGTLGSIRAREAAHFLPVVKRLPVALVEGRGSRVRDVAGREYIDLMAGWGVTCLGHCHPALVEAIREQAGRLMQTTNVCYTLPQLDLIERLAEVLPRTLSKSFIVNSGTEAVEGALKLAHRATGRTKYVSTH